MPCFLFRGVRVTWSKYKEPFRKKKKSIILFLLYKYALLCIGPPQIRDIKQNTWILRAAWKVSLVSL